jgi:hypothetical protein
MSLSLKNLQNIQKDMNSLGQNSNKIFIVLDSLKYYKDDINRANKAYV